MRDALSTLEQLSVFGNGTVHADDARSLLGEVSDQILGEFARAIADRDVAELYGLIRAQVEEGKKSVAFNLVYRDKNKTLTDEEVTDVHEDVLQALKEKLNAVLRDM